MDLAERVFQQFLDPPTLPLASQPTESSTFTVQTTRSGAAPPAPIRRGRGTFARGLHTEMLSHLPPPSESASSVLTGVTTSLVLPSAASTSSTTAASASAQTSARMFPEEEEDGDGDPFAPTAYLKKDIPLHMPSSVPLHPVSSSSANSVLSAGLRGGDLSGSAGLDRNDVFGESLRRLVESPNTDTVRQLLFRGEKRRRYCVIVGNLQDDEKEVTLKLFGHKGNKPFKLQNKLIRLINLSIGKPRTQRLPVTEEGAEQEEDRKQAEDAEVKVENAARVKNGEEQDSQLTAVDPKENTSGGEERIEHGKDGAKIAERANVKTADSDLTAAESDVKVDDKDANRVDERPDVPRTAEKDAQSVADAHLNVSDAANTKVAEDGIKLSDQKEVKPTTTTAATHLKEPSREPLSPLQGSSSASLLWTVDDRKQNNNNNNSNNNSNSNDSFASLPQPDVSTNFVHTHPDISTGFLDDADATSEHGDVDHYFERREDEVVPLIVERGTNPNTNSGAALGHHAGLANSPVLTARYFATLTEYFAREFRTLLELDDVQSQNISLRFNLGSAYCCLARRGSHATPLKHTSFIRLVERMNDESMQLYFIKDCPTCVSRAVDVECGAQQEIALTMVQIHFFSNERQSRMTARAFWNSEQNAFKLMDMEGRGVFFNWTVFSLDETEPTPRAGRAPANTHLDSSSKDFNNSNPSSRDLSTGMPAHSSAERSQPPTTPTTASVGRKKTVAYPFEVEFHSFRRWKQDHEHPAVALVHAILDKLSLAEHNFINYGSRVGYERMDLSQICEADYASEDYNVESIVVEHTIRLRPKGTQLLVDNTTALYIENFAAARQLKEQISRYGPERIAAMQKPSNNNFMRGGGGGGVAPALGARRAQPQPPPQRAPLPPTALEPNPRSLPGNNNNNSNKRHSPAGPSTPAGKLPDYMEEVLCPSSKLTFFRSRGSTVHWRLRPGNKTEENLAPLAGALAFVHQVLHTANTIERSALRGGAAPEAL